MPTLQKIVPMLWFDQQAEEAVAFYTSIFPNSKIEAVTRYSAQGPGPVGSVMTVAFEIEGQKFVALNGGPIYKFTEAISLMVYCKDQDEVDEYWEKLSADAHEVQCGWLKDKYGLSWQVVPTRFMEMIQAADAEQSSRVMKALFQMKKIDLAKLEEAYRG